MIAIFKKTLLTTVIFTWLLTRPSIAQDLNDPGAYMNALTGAQTTMNQTYMAYLSAAAHSSRTKKIENLRQQTLESINDAKYAVTSIPKYKGDNSLKQSSLDYIKLCYNIFNEDYSKIVNLGEIAEQSFDEMQALVLLKEKTNEKIQEASEQLNTAQKDFAAKYNVTIDNTENEFDNKMETAGELNHYHDELFLLFFKCNWQDNKIVEAFNKNNLTNIEQSRNALISYAKEGLAALDTIKLFENDPSLKTACRQALNGYQKMATTDLPKQTDYYLKKDNFDKLKKTFEQKDESNLSKEEIKTFNKAVDEMNAASATYNKTNSNLNNTRSNIVDSWNNASKDFIDTHMPHYKK